MSKKVVLRRGLSVPGVLLDTISLTGFVTSVPLYTRVTAPSSEIPFLFTSIGRILGSPKVISFVADVSSGEISEILFA